MAAAVTPKVSTGIKLSADRTGGATTTDVVLATVDFSVNQRAPRQEKTAQLSALSAIGVRSHLPGLRERELSFSLRFDQAADAGATTYSHAEMFADFINGMKPNWLMTYPPTVGAAATYTLSYTGMRTRTFRAVITSFKVRGSLGTVVTADVTLQICGAVTEGTAA